jgi:predicted nucleotidyltransferase
VNRKHEKRDIADIRTLLREYGDAVNEDRLYGAELNVLEAEGCDFELAGARLIGRDAAGVISEDRRRRARDTLESEPLMEELTNQFIVSSMRNGPEHLRRCELLVSKLREGFLSVAQLKSGNCF